MAEEGRRGVIDRTIEDDRIIELRVGVDELEDVRQEFIELLRSPEVFADIPPTGSGIPVTEFRAYIELATATAPLLLLVAQRFIAWRDKRRQQGRPGGIRIISRSGKTTVEVENATDKEIIICITEGREQAWTGGKRTREK